MGDCEYCGSLLDGSSCRPRVHSRAGVRMETERYGADGWWAEDPRVDPPPNCHDCQLALGGHHHFGCDNGALPARRRPGVALRV